MLSFERGTPIAIIKGGKYDGKVLKLYDKEAEDEKKQFENNKKGKKTKEYDLDLDDPYDVIDEDYIRSKKKKLSVLELLKIKNALSRSREPDESHLCNIYNDIKGDFVKKAQKEFVIHDGIVTPYNTDPNKPDRIYISGPTGSGKSCFINAYLSQQLKAIKKPIIVFSDKLEDKPIDELKPNRMQLDEELVENPIEPEELKNSYVIFDDIDSISDRKVNNAVGWLRDRILKKGRSSGITTIITNHQIANYKETRTTLNESNFIVFFPKGGGGHAVKYLLTKYLGLSKEQISRIFDLPSRWVCVHKQYPMYVIYSSGCYLL